MLVFVEGGKLENPEKNLQSKARTNNKLNPHMALAWATLVGGERSHHCAIPAPLLPIPAYYSVAGIHTHLTAEVTFTQYLMTQFVTTLHSVVHLDCSFW